MYKGESANHLFHFTSEYKHIVSILTEKFKPFFCLEDISYMYEEKRNDIIAIPIVCFCDIPLERQTQHITNYGEYGIGLKKEWGIKKNLSIVNYSNKESAKASAMRLITTIYPEIIKLNLNDNDLQIFKNAYSLILMSSKPYEGFRIDKNAKQDRSKTYRFYDEREWRYIPLIKKLKWSVSLSEFNDDTTKFFEAIKEEQDLYHEDSSLRLQFYINDIDYIFLKNENEISNLRDDLAKHFSNEEIICIMSKVITREKTQKIAHHPSITLEVAKEKFLAIYNQKRNSDTAASEAIRSAVQRANVYSPNLTYRNKVTIQKYWAGLLHKIGDRYSIPRSLDLFIQDIDELKCEMNKKFPTSFNNKKYNKVMGFRIAQAQKSLSVYLKHLWCMDIIPTPPACPIDRRILTKAKADYKSRKWTHINTIPDYKKQLCLLTQIPNKCEQLAEWELKEFN